MAIFCIRSENFIVLRTGYRGAESNLGKPPMGVGLLPVSPPLCGANQAVGDQAEPEIHQEAEIDLKQFMTGSRWQGGLKDIIRCISQQHGQERLQVIGDHGTFRHRCRLLGSTKRKARHSPIAFVPVTISPAISLMLELSTSVQYVKG